MKIFWSTETEWSGMLPSVGEMSPELQMQFLGKEELELAILALSVSITILTVSNSFTDWGYRVWLAEDIGREGLPFWL
jgi:hypothetical protein